MPDDLPPNPEQPVQSPKPSPGPPKRVPIGPPPKAATPEPPAPPKVVKPVRDLPELASSTDEQKAQPSMALLFIAGMITGVVPMLIVLIIRGGATAREHQLKEQVDRSASEILQLKNTIDVLKRRRDEDLAAELAAAANVTFDALGRRWRRPVAHSEVGGFEGWLWELSDNPAIGLRELHKVDSMGVRKETMLQIVRRDSSPGGWSGDGAGIFIGDRGVGLMFINGDKFNGDSIVWDHTTGRLSSIMQYAGGQQHGMALSWDDRGDIRSDTTYVRGVVSARKGYKRWRHEIDR